MAYLEEKKGEIFLVKIGKNFKNGHFKLIFGLEARKKSTILRVFKYRFSKKENFSSRNGTKCLKKGFFRRILRYVSKKKKKEKIDAQQHAPIGVNWSQLELFHSIVLFCINLHIFEWAMKKNKFNRYLTIRSKKLLSFSFGHVRTVIFSS